MQEESSPVTTERSEFDAFYTAVFFSDAAITARLRKRKIKIHDCAKALHNSFTRQLNAFTPAQLHALDCLLEQGHDDITLLLRPATILNAEQALAESSPSVSHAGLTRLLMQCREPDLGAQLVRMAAKSGRCSLASPFSDTQAYCRSSVWASGLNALRFEDGQQSFFLFQKISSADCLYFPHQHLLIYLAHARQFDLRAFYIAELENIRFRLAHMQTGEPDTWAGVIASHARPAHFYYEVLPAVARLADDRALAAQVPEVVSCEDHDFYNLGALYPVLRWRAIANKTLRESGRTGQWWLLLGDNPHQRRTDDDHEVLDAHLLAHACATPSTCAKARLAEVDGCHPLIWVGIEGQKRCWLEQVAGIAHVLNQLALQYPKLGVVIDGWTQPLTPADNNTKQVRRDLVIARKLTARLAPGIRHTLTVGENSHTKLNLANRIDFFITNFASGSLHVSRIARKPGFCHMSNALAEHSLSANVQIHPNRQVRLLPRRLVHDQPASTPSWLQKIGYLLQGRRVGRKTQTSPEAGDISYSISPADALAYIQPRVEAMLAPPAPHVQLFLEPSFSIHPDVRRYVSMACYGKLKPVFPTLATTPSLAALAKWSPRRLSNTLVYGLFSVGDEKSLPLPCDFLLWLGNPERRTQLHVLQFIENARAEGRTESVDDVLDAGHKALDNYYTRLLSGIDVPFGECTQEMLSAARDQLQKRTGFIGFDEDQSGSFDRLCIHMDWDRDIFPLQLQARMLIPPAAFSQASLLRIQAMVQFDRALYREAMQQTSTQGAGAQKNQ